MTGSSPTGLKPLREKKPALSGSGPIVDRARNALAKVAAQFGAVVATTETTVTVECADRLRLLLSYQPGNYVFSRVYNLTITAELPSESPLPTGLSLSFRGGKGGRFVQSSTEPGKRAASRSTTLTDLLNATFQQRLSKIDLIAASVEKAKARNGLPAKRTITLSPMGGSFVWVLIPPVFSATAFPAGEPERITELIQALCNWAPDDPSPDAPNDTPNGAPPTIR